MQAVGENQGASLVEFAVSLPLLVVLAVGIIDFGAAFNLKQELNNAVREGARFGAAQPTNDLCSSCTAPPSIDAVRYLVDAYLQAARINDCGLSAMTAAQSSSGPPWAYAASSGCGGGTLTLTIARDPQGSTSPTCPPTGAPMTASNYGASGVTVNISCTSVSTSYPFQWHFNNVIQLISPGTTFALSTIQTSTTAENME